MAKISFNQLVEVIRGRIKGLVIRQRPDGIFILSGTPRYKKNRGTPRQKAHWQHVSEVTQEAKDLARIHPIYSQLALEDNARGKWLSAYNFAFADCMKPPVIHRIERAEGCIRVQVTDNVLVDKVYVTILDRAGKPLARGRAAWGAGDWWEFPTHIEGAAIVAEAYDLPRNCTRLEMSSPSCLPQIRQ
jgi:hypothetical protein